MHSRLQLSQQSSHSNNDTLTTLSPSIGSKTGAFTITPPVVENAEPETSNISSITLTGANPSSDDVLAVPGSDSHSSATSSQPQAPKLKISRAQLQSIPKREKLIRRTSRPTVNDEENVEFEARELVIQLSPKRSRASTIDHDLISTEPVRKRPKVEPRFEGTIHVQDRRCYISSYKNWTKCLACVAKKTGEPCRFTGIRGFPIAEDGTLSGPPQFHRLPTSVEQQTPDLEFHREWYQSPSESHIRRIKQSVAKVILPKLQSELIQIIGDPDRVIRRPRETEVRVTCDRCLTSIFSTSYLCTFCGREFCFDCYSSLENIETIENLDVGRNSSGYYKCCFMGGRYSVHDARMFLPVSRLSIEELESSISEMKQAITDDDGESTSVAEEDNSTRQANIDSISEQTDEHKIGALEPPTNDIHPESPTQLSDHSCQTFNDDSSLTPLSSDTNMSLPEAEDGDRTIVLPQPIIDPITGAYIDPAAIESLAIDRFDCELDEYVFSNLWKDGKSLVVSGLLKKMTTDWTPEYFIQHYGEQTCLITDCDSQSTTEATVANFFTQFGLYDERDQKILKLKDWPPTSDFKVTFPTLFQDFQSAVPAPNYTRRDGFYNVSTHFPRNVVAPDMGPKMYNAFASREDGHGSTRLHMDMADAVNIMLYASPPPGQTVGVAVWDIYPSTASNAIRQFLREEFPLAKSPIKYVDPIHSQYFYLTPQLRKKMFHKYGVNGWRIYQKPGDAVFIPAGCAHQVCNLADCMKVAVDFVSPENLDRCGQLTKEFRQENQQVTWKEDILQLTNMCWNAWINTKQLEKGISTND